MATERKKSKVAPKEAVMRKLRWLVDESAILNEEGSPFTGSMTEGDHRLTIIVGENASGKSLVVRGLSQLVLEDAGVTPVAISIRERTEGGLKRAFMFGEEHRQSTGATSVGTVMTGFNQKYDKPWMLILDEPELGLSEGYTKALGEFIGTKAAEPHENNVGVVVVTHSRKLVEGVLHTFPGTPTFVQMSDESLGISDWLLHEEHRTVDDLLKLREIGHSRMLQVGKILKNG